MAIRTAVVGGSGYTGAELLRILSGHPEFEVALVSAQSQAGNEIRSIYPGLASAYGETRFDELRLTELTGFELIFLALPHGKSQVIVPKVLANAVPENCPKIVDLAADFRLPSGVYEQWYGEPHGAPELIKKFAFGMPELFRPTIKVANHVANPGCYPTAASLALAPLVANGLVEPTGIVINACSGVSGRGRSLSQASQYVDVNESVSAYGLLNHRHTAEIEYALGRIKGQAVEVLFTPHLVPMTRGIIATCTARPAVSGLSTKSLLETYRAHYEAEPFINIVDDPVPTSATSRTNNVFLTTRFDPRTGTVLAIGVEDNLVKGAAGQAIQNANLLFGLPETLGLMPGLATV